MPPHDSTLTASSELCFFSMHQPFCLQTKLNIIWDSGGIYLPPLSSSCSTCKQKFCKHPVKKKPQRSAVQPGYTTTSDKKHSSNSSHNLTGLLYLHSVSQFVFWCPCDCHHYQEECNQYGHYQTRHSFIEQLRGEHTPDKEMVPLHCHQYHIESYWQCSG